MGQMTLGEYRETNDAVRYVRDLDQFRQIARVAGAQNLCILNGSYVYDEELLGKYAEMFPDVECEVVDPESLAQTFDELEMDELEAVHDFLDAAEEALRPYKCTADVKKFLPRELPAMYTTDREGRYLRSLEQSKELSNSLWSSVLDKISKSHRHSPAHSQICFNFHNPLIKRLVSVTDRALLKRSVQMLYIQALLLGHHPLSSKEMALLNDGLLALIEHGIGN